MRLPQDIGRWPPDALEEAKERASIIFEGCRGETQADWLAARVRAVEIVRERWARECARYVPQSYGTDPKGTERMDGSARKTT